MNGFRLVAPGVWQLALLPLDNMNVYLVGDVLVDSGAVLTRRRLLAALRERQIAAHLLTHAHPDHQGASHAVCLERSVPLWCGSGDRDAAQSGDLASLVRHPGSMVGRFDSWPRPSRELRVERGRRSGRLQGGRDARPHAGSHRAVAAEGRSARARRRPLQPQSRDSATRTTRALRLGNMGSRPESCLRAEAGGSWSQTCVLRPRLAARGRTSIRGICSAAAWMTGAPRWTALQQATATDTGIRRVGGPLAFSSRPLLADGPCSRIARR